MNSHLLPKVITNEDTNPYWENILKGNLTIQRCRMCTEIWAYPQNVCCNCLSTDIVSVPCQGTGVIYSYTIILRAPTPEFSEKIPYAIGIIELDEGCKIMAEIIGPLSEIKINKRVSVVYSKSNDVFIFPKFSIDFNLEAYATRI
jgi:uncharacterized protein